MCELIAGFVFMVSNHLGEIKMSVVWEGEVQRSEKDAMFCNGFFFEKCENEIQFWEIRAVGRPLVSSATARIDWKIYGRCKMASEGAISCRTERLKRTNQAL